MLLAVQTKQTSLPRGWWTKSMQFMLALVTLHWKAAGLLITKMRINFFHQDEHFYCEVAIETVNTVFLNTSSVKK